MSISGQELAMIQRDRDQLATLMSTDPVPGDLMLRIQGHLSDLLHERAQLLKRLEEGYRVEHEVNEVVVYGKVPAPELVALLNVWSDGEAEVVCSSERAALVSTPEVG